LVVWSILAKRKHFYKMAATELGQLLLQEQSLSRSTTSPFCEQLGQLLYEHRYHESSTAALKIFLTSLLVSSASVKQANYPPLLSDGSLFDIGANHVSLALSVQEGKGGNMLKGFTFFLNGTDDAVFRRDLLVNLRYRASRMRITKVYTHYYSLTLKYDAVRKERVYHVEKTCKKIDTRNAERETLDQHIPQLITMPEMNVTALNFFDNHHQSQDEKHVTLFNLLAHYFADPTFQTNLKKLGGKIDAEFMLRAVHAIVAGHFQKTYQISTASFLDHHSGHLLSMSMKSERVFCSPIPIMFWTEPRDEQDEKLLGSMFTAQYTVPSTTHFTDSRFLSVYVECQENECIWRTDEQRVKNRERLLRPLRSWKNQDTRSFLTYIKQDLMYLVGKLPLGHFLCGYFASDRFANLFRYKTVLTPNTERDYFTFVLLYHNMFALIINVADKPTGSAEWLQNVHTSEHNQRETQVVNIMLEQDPRLNKINPNEYETAETFLPGYKVVVERQITTKPSGAVLVTNETIGLHDPEPFYQLGSNRNSLDYTKAMLELVSKLVPVYSSVQELAALFQGLVSQYTNSYNLAGTDLVVHRMDRLGENQFLLVQLKNLVDMQTSGDGRYLDNVKRQLKGQHPFYMKIHVVSVYLEDCRNLSTAIICGPHQNSNEETTCSKRNGRQENDLFLDWSSVIEIDASMQPETNNQVDTSMCQQQASEIRYRMAKVSSARLLRYERHTLNKIHTVLLYNVLGENLKVLGDKKLSRLALRNTILPFTNLTDDFYNTNDNCDHAEQVPSNNDILDSMFQENSKLQHVLSNVFKTLQISHDKSQENMTIVPVDDGVYFGLFGTKLLVTFSLQGIHNLLVNTQSSSENNVVFLDAGSKALRTGPQDDVILIEKAVQLSGFVNALGGNDTVFLVADSEVLMTKYRSVFVKSEPGNLLTVKNTEDDELILYNVEHFVGAKNSPDFMDYTGGLVTVNLQGGLLSRFDMIKVDVVGSQDETTIILDRNTDVEHVSSNGKLRYKVVEGPVKFVVVSNATSTDHEDNKPTEIAVEHDLFDITDFRLVWSSDTKTASAHFSFNDAQQLELFHIDSSFQITFQGDYSLNIQDGIGHLTRNCTNHPEHIQIDPNFSRMLTENKIILNDQCKNQPTVVYTGLNIDNTQTDDDILPNPYRLLENDHNQAETYFTELNDPITTGVYKLKTLCSDPRKECQHITATIETGKQQFVDLREATRLFEDLGRTVVIKAFEKVDQNVPDPVRIYVTDGQQSKLLVHLDLKRSVHMLDFVTILTSRYQHRLNSALVVHTTLLAKNSRQLMMIDYESRRKFLEADQQAQEHQQQQQQLIRFNYTGQHWKKVHGDQLVFDHVTSDGVTVSAIFLHLQKKIRCLE